VGHAVYKAAIISAYKLCSGKSEREKKYGSHRTTLKRIQKIRWDGAE
jgi:hypothetical protein